MCWGWLELLHGLHAGWPLHKPGVQVAVCLLECVFQSGLQQCAGMHTTTLCVPCIPSMYQGRLA